MCVCVCVYTYIHKPKSLCCTLETLSVNYISIKKLKLEFPSWLSGEQVWLSSMRRRVQSLALLGGLRIRCCHEVWCRPHTWLGSLLLWLWCRLVAAALIPPRAWQPPLLTVQPQKAKKKKKRKKKRNTVFWRLTPIPLCVETALCWPFVHGWTQELLPCVSFGD